VTSGTDAAARRPRTAAAPAAGSRGDADIAAVGALLGDPSRCAILLALDDGRELTASRLAAEAGVSQATASSHLGKLVAGGLLAVEAHGRNRYYRLAGPQVGQLVESLIQLAPAAPVTSLRQASKGERLRQARTCYDHLAGRLGVALMRSLIDRGYLTGGDGTSGPNRRAGYGHEIDYRLTDAGQAFLGDLGVRLPPHRPAIRYCVDWSEHAHHLAGAAGRALLNQLVELGWIRRTSTDRAVTITQAGRTGLASTFDIHLHQTADRA
jgi:DNA-binding transcriptional ArsR family regulator